LSPVIHVRDAPAVTVQVIGSGAMLSVTLPRLVSPGATVDWQAAARARKRRCRPVRVRVDEHAPLLRRARVRDPAVVVRGSRAGGARCHL
jgi:hypothetical protein